MIHKTVLKFKDLVVISECHKKFHLDLEHVTSRISYYHIAIVYRTRIIY